MVAHFGRGQEKPGKGMDVAPSGDDLGALL
jgi:hypothetical protein